MGRALCFTRSFPDERQVRSACPWWADQLNKSGFLPDAALSPGETSVDFVLELAGNVTGTVLTPWGTPLGCENLSTLRRGRKISNAFINSKGHFKAHVPLGEVVSLAVDFGAGGEFISETEQSPRVRVAGVLEGVCAGDQNLVLQLKIAPLDSRRLQVRVQSPAGLPVSSATVCVRNGSVSTSTLGMAEFSGLEARLTNVLVYPPEPCPSDWVMECVKDVCPEGQELLVTLREGTRLSGRVILPDGRPGSGARLRFVTGDSVARDAEAGLDGVFTILLDARAPWHLGDPGVYVLHADCRDREMTFSGQAAVRLPLETEIVVKVGQDR